MKTRVLFLLLLLLFLLLLLNELGGDSSSSSSRDEAGGRVGREGGSLLYLSQQIREMFSGERGKEERERRK